MFSSILFFTFAVYRCNAVFSMFISDSFEINSDCMFVYIVSPSLVVSDFASVDSVSLLY